MLNSAISNSAIMAQSAKLRKFGFIELPEQKRLALSAADMIIQ